VQTANEIGSEIDNKNGGRILQLLNGLGKYKKDLQPIMAGVGANALWGYVYHRNGNLWTYHHAGPSPLKVTSIFLSISKPKSFFNFAYFNSLSSKLHNIYSDSNLGVFVNGYVNALNSDNQSKRRLRQNNDGRQPLRPLKRLAVS
jgi:hypothetical protein